MSCAGFAGGFGFVIYRVYRGALGTARIVLGFPRFLFGLTYTDALRMTHTSMADPPVSAVYLSIAVAPLPYTAGATSPGETFGFQPGAAGACPLAVAPVRLND